MSTKASNRAAAIRQQKKTQFSKPAPATHRKNMMIVGALVTIGLLSYLFGRGLADQPVASAVTVSTSTAAGRATNGVASATGDIVIPISDVASGQAKYFRYVASNRTAMRFFVIKSSDGVYRAALDACDVCYQHKRGYQQMGDDMVCRQCGRHFPSKLVNEVTGGCNPVAVARTIAGSNVLIRAADLETLNTYF